MRKENLATESNDRKSLSLAELELLLAKAQAYPFVCNGWTYTRDLNIKSIRFKDSSRAYWPIRKNLQFAWAHLRPWKLKDWEKDLYGMVLEGKGLIRRYLTHVQIAVSWLTYRDAHLPDGVVNDGIYTTWEEAGEHIAAFNPAVTEELVRLAIVGHHAENSKA